MLKAGFLFLQVVNGEVKVPVPQGPIIQQPTPNNLGAGIPIPVPITVPVPIPTPVPVPVPVIVTVPVPVPVPMPMTGGEPMMGVAVPPGQEVPPPQQLGAGMFASCQAHPGCRNINGLCCPTANGATMQCCSSSLSHWEADAKYIITLASGATVRAEKSSTSPEVTTYEYGQVFDVLEHAVDEFNDERLRTKDGWINAKCHETGEHVADHVLPNGPGELYVATAPKGLIVRSGLETTSPQVDGIERGKTFHVLERVLNSQGLLRLRVEAGWVSESCSKTSERIAEPVAPKASEHYTVVSPEGFALYQRPDMNTKVDSPSYKEGDEINVVERFIAKDGRQFLRTSSGWFPELSETGQVVVQRTRRSRPATVPLQSCQAHPGCSKIEGFCCPTEQGAMMACCSSKLKHWEADAKYIITLNEGADVWTDKSENSEKKMTYEFGTSITVLAHAVDESGAEWLQTSDGWIRAACRDTNEHIADHTLPQEPELYIATAPKGLVVREGVEKSSKQVDSLKRGELFHVLERAISSQGIVRLRSEDGWVSETCSKGGARVAEPLAPKTVEHYTVKAEQIQLYVDAEQTVKSEDDVLTKDSNIDIIERHITPDGICRLRTTAGWFSEVSETGERVAIRTRGGREARIATASIADSTSQENAATPEDATSSSAGSSPDPAIAEATADAIADAKEDASKDAKDEL